MSPRRRAHARRNGWRAAAGWGLVAGVVGLVLNRVELPLAPAVQLVAGPLAVLAAATLLGPVGGTVAGAVAGATTYVAWGHPWAWLGLALEGLAVGLLARRARPLRADALYWVFGVPYVAASYVLGLDVPLRDAMVVAVKQCLNGLLAALLLQTVLLVPRVRRALGPRLPRSMRRVPFADAVLVALLLGTALPMVVVGAVQGRALYTTERGRMDAQNALSARAVADALGGALAAGHQPARLLARELAEEAAATGALPPPAALQRRLATWAPELPQVQALLVRDAGGRTLAVHPPGAPGAARAPPAEQRRLETTLRPGVTGVLREPEGSGASVVASAPVLRDGALLGHVAVRLAPEALRALAEARRVGPQRVRVVDAAGLVVFDTGGGGEVGDGSAALAPGTPVAGLPLGAALAGAGNGRPGVYSTEPQGATLRRTRASHAYVTATVAEAGWRVVVEQPLGFVDRAAYDSYATLLGGLAGAFVLAALGARVLARIVARPLEAVASAATRFRRGQRTARAGLAGREATLEVARLGASVDSMAHRLVSQLEALERAGRERDQFLSAASHELKTPLATLKAHVQLLQRRLPASEGPTMGRLLRQLDRITRLVNQMLDVAELESGRLALAEAPVALHALVRTTAERRVAVSEQHTLVLELEEAVVLGDAARLEGLVHALVDNAVKFSPEGGPVEVRLRARDGWAVLDVADRGVGLGPGDAEALLQRFPGGQLRSVARVAGLGVGLFFCREVAERHGGSVHLHPREGGGVRAEVRLPRVGPAPRALPAPDEALAEA